MSLPSTAVTHRQVPAQQVASITMQVQPGQLSDFVNEAAGTLKTLLAQQGAVVIGPCLVLYHGDVDDAHTGPVEVCLPYLGILTGLVNVNLYEAPARFEAYLELNRAGFEQPGLSGAYRATFAYAQANGTPYPRPCEYYYQDSQDSGPDAVVGEVAWPFEWRNQLRPAGTGVQA
jgi:hypothetical protein